MTGKIMTEEKTDLKFYEAIVEISMVPYFEEKLKEKRESIQSVYTYDTCILSGEADTKAKGYVIAAKDEIISKKAEIPKEEYDELKTVIDLKEFDF